MSTPRQRWLVLGGGLAITVALAGWLSIEPNAPGVVEANGRAVRGPGSERSQSEPVPAAALADLLAGRDQAADGAGIKEVFAVQTWVVPPPPSTAPPEPPPLPFTYFGKIIDGDQILVFVKSAERNFAMRKGDVIDGTYLVEEIAPPTMTVVYLPLSRKQTLEIGSAK